MSSNRKYAALPDLDFAPDVYETPELTDDASTRPTSTALRSDSQTSSYPDLEEDSTGITRHHLDPDEARSHFIGSRIDARSANFSDRIDARRKSYRASSRRKRKGDETEDMDDSSDEEISSESLQRRIARLNREAEELKAELSKRQPEEHSSTTDDSVMQLETALRTLHTLDGLGPIGAEARLAQRLKTAMSSTREPNEASTSVPDPNQKAAYTLTYAPSYQQDHAMSKAADFDHRLSLLEAALGLASVPLPSANSSTISKPLLPALDLLDRRISIVASTSTTSLESMSKRIHQLTRDADKLDQARRSAKAAQEALKARSSDEFAPARQDSLVVLPGHVGEGVDDPEQLAKINALYGALPTIESLAPVLPAVLDRLRSLRLIHADAAAASESLGRVEQRQADMEAEIKTWREGLEKVEGVMREGEQSMAANMKLVEDWVKELEGRMAQLD